MNRKKINISRVILFYLTESVVPVYLRIGISGDEELNVPNFRFCTKAEGITYFIK